MQVGIHRHLPTPPVCDQGTFMKNQKGLSIVELMIAVTLGLILTIAVVQIFLGSRQTFTSHQSMSRIQETGRLAIEFLSKDIRMVASTGFRGQLKTVVNKIASPGVYRNYAEGVSVVNSATGITQLSGTDILVLRGVFQSDPSIVIDSISDTTISVDYVSEQTGACGGANGFNGLCPTDDLIISDYRKAIAFAATAMAKDGSKVNITKASGWGGNAMQYNEHFISGAHVSKISSIAYYIANGTSGRPSLFQRINGENVELLEGVMDFRIAVAQANDLDSFDYLTSAGEVALNWNDAVDENPLVAIRIEILVAGPDDQLLDEPQTYNFGGADVTAGDRRMHQVFATTINLRNQVR